MPSSYDKLSNNDVVLPGLNRIYGIGITAYRYVYRKDSNFAKLIPVCWIDGQWTPTQDEPLFKELCDYCTILSR